MSFSWHTVFKKLYFRLFLGHSFIRSEQARLLQCPVMYIIQPVEMDTEKSKEPGAPNGQRNIPEYANHSITPDRLSAVGSFSFQTFPGLTGISMSDCLFGCQLRFNL